MIAITCPVQNQRTLVFDSDITAVRSVLGGFEIDFACSCGGTGTWLTGRAVRDALLSHIDPWPAPSRDAA